MLSQPLIFKPFFQNDSFYIEREEMTKENVSHLLQNKVDLKRGSGVPPAANLVEMDNYISRFTNKD
jgi:hypothetical protein